MQSNWLHMPTMRLLSPRNRGTRCTFYATFDVCVGNGVEDADEYMLMCTMNELQRSNADVCVMCVPSQRASLPPSLNGLVP